MKHPAILTPRFDSALQLASELHRNQTRKATTVPYIAHLLAVCALVLQAGGDEDQAIAALLHDAVEDQGGLPTLEKIRHRFGDRVANAVKSCSDSTASDPTKKLPWRQRKEQYLEHLRSASEDAILISTADKLHNAQSMLADYRQIGERMWEKFNAGKTEQFWFYETMVRILRETGKAPKAMVDELGDVVHQLRACADSAQP